MARDANNLGEEKASVHYVIWIEPTSHVMYCHMSMWRNGEKVLNRTNISYDHARAIAADLHASVKEFGD